MDKNKLPTAEEADPASSAKPKKKRGGQPGNRNALKHGLYARFLLPDEKKGLENESLGELKDEIDLMRAYIFRTLKFFMKNPPATAPDQLSTLRSIAAAMTCLQGFYRTQKTVFDNIPNPIDEFLKAIEYDPSEEDE